MEKPKSNGGKPPKRGRPPKLVADAQTLEIIIGLGKISATHEESAAVLGVCRQTFATFFNNNKKVSEAYENGVGSGKVSLRRAQFKSALGGNATMQVWLGKQLLEQKDMSRHEHAGKDGGPIQVEHNGIDAFLEQLRQLRRRIEETELPPMINGSLANGHDAD